MITPEELAAMKARCEKATAGPWTIPHLGHGGDCLARDKDEGDWTRIARNVKANDLAFIASSRTDVPRLLAEVERLRRVEHTAKYFRLAMRTPLKTGNERFDAQDDLFAALDAAEGGA